MTIMDAAAPPKHWKYFIYLLGYLLLIILLLGLLMVGLFYTFRLPPSRSANAFSGLVFCHRGSVFDAPENTLTAFRRAYEDGCTNVEMDVRATKDNVLVILHDDSLDRTTNAHGSIKDYTYADLQKVKVVFRGQLTQEKIPTLEQAMHLIKQLHMKAELSFWFVYNKNNYAKQVVDYYQKMDLYDSTLASSFYPLFLYQLRRIDSRIITSLGIFKRPVPNHPFISRLIYWSQLSWMPRFLGIGLMEPYYKYISLNFVTRWEEKNIYTNAFTVNSAADKAWFMYHHITFQTDCFKGSCAPHNYDLWK